MAGAGVDQPNTGTYAGGGGSARDTTWEKRGWQAVARRAVGVDVRTAEVLITSAYMYHIYLKYMYIHASVFDTRFLFGMALT